VRVRLLNLEATGLPAWDSSQEGANL